MKIVAAVGVVGIFLHFLSLRSSESCYCRCRRDLSQYMQSTAEDSESSKEDGTEASGVEDESADENVKRLKAALDKLEKASEDSLLSRSVKFFDDSVDSLTSGAWQALGNAWKEGANLVQKSN